MSAELDKARGALRTVQTSTADGKMAMATAWAQVAAAAALERIAAAQERAAEAAAIEAQIQLHFLEENEGDVAADDIYRRIATVHSPLLSDVTEGRDEGADG